MIGLMAVLFGVGVLIGVDMMYFVFRPEPKRPPFYMQLAHGLTGAGGVGIATYAVITKLHDPGAYGWQALAFVVIAFLLGLGLYVFGRHNAVAEGQIADRDRRKQVGQSGHGACVAAGQVRLRANKASMAAQPRSAAASSYTGKSAFIHPCAAPA